MHAGCEDEAIMHRHRINQPLSRGFTLVEVMVGIAVSGIVALVVAGLFRAGILTFNYVVRQNYALSAARKALAGDGAKHGVVWMSQGAALIEDLEASSLTVSPPNALSLKYHVDEQGLCQSQLGVKTMQAEGVGAVALGYYNLNDVGRIIESTAPASAIFITAMVSIHGKNPRHKTYHFFSGAQLRNHP